MHEATAFTVFLHFMFIMVNFLLRKPLLLQRVVVVCARLLQVTEEHKVELKQLCQRLEEAEEQRKIITQDRSQVKVSVRFF